MIGVGNMKQMQQNGFTITEVVAATVILVVLIAMGWIIFSRESPREPQHIQKTDIQSSNTTKEVLPISWQFNGEEWSASGAPPTCTDPVLQRSPLNLDGVRAVLYPGQSRGGDYKAHGGFHVKQTAIDIVMPLDATPWRIARYLEGGEVQHMIDFISPCGIMMRFDHLLTMNGKYAELMNTLPPPQEGDSRTTIVQNQPMVRAGDVVATEVGHKQPVNMGFDFGVYDLRKRNAASANASWAATTQSKKEQAFYGVCWLDWFDPDTNTRLHSFPAGDGQLGKTSDYCK